MQKISIHNLKRRIERRSTILSIPDLFEYLTLDDVVEDSSGDSTFIELLESALEEFEYYEPLITDSKVYFENTESYEFVDNLDIILQGILGEDYLQLVPRELVGITSTYTPRSIWDKNFIYEKPRLRAHYRNGWNWVRGIYSRPLRYKYDDAEKLIKEESFLYYIPTDTSVEFGMFINQLLYTMIEFILQSANNMKYPGYPIELFEGLRDKMATLRSTLDDFYKTSQSNNKLFI